MDPRSTSESFLDEQLSASPRVSLMLVPLRQSLQIDRKLIVTTLELFRPTVVFMWAV